MSSLDLSIRFVCQKGEIEYQSMLLAASLRKYLQHSSAEIVACVPEPTSVWGAPSSSTIKFLEQLEVKFESIVNPISVKYPIGNKLACLAVPSDADTVVFLDSDMLCMNKLSFGSASDGYVMARAAGHLTWGNIAKGENWNDVYACCGSQVGTDMIQTAVSGVTTPLYLNSGLIAVNQNVSLANNWVKCCKLIDSNPDIPNKRPWLDQIGLPPAIQMTGLKVAQVGIEYNFPPKGKMDSSRLPSLYHYHKKRFLQNCPFAIDEIESLVTDYRVLEESQSFFMKPDGNLVA